MAPHLRQYDLWDEFATAVDDVWEQLGLDTAIKQLQWLRSPVTPGGVVVSNDGKLVSLNDVDAQSRSSLVLTADLLGFRFNAPNLLRQKDYLRLCQNLANYYISTKGTPGWTDFLGWCLEAEFKTVRTFTKDYKQFLLEGDPAIGNTIEKGGEWYPTTHVLFEYEADRWQGIHPSTKVQLFNYFANINLVLWMTQMTGRFEVPVQASITGSILITYPSS